MGQYYYVINIDKKQYLHAHKFGDGLKLLEFGSSGGGTMCGLALLLADGNNRGGGDMRSENDLIGSWAGDRIVIGGDYADHGRFIEGKLTKEQMEEIREHFTEGYKPNTIKDLNLYHYAQACFEDISAKVVECMAEDSWLKEDLEKAGCVTKDGKWKDRFGGTR